MFDVGLVDMSQSFGFFGGKKNDTLGCGWQKMPSHHKSVRSYGGHYVPSLGNYLLQNPGPFQLEAVMVGDGLTDPAIQVWVMGWVGSPMVDILEGLYLVKRFKEHSNITTIDGLVYSGKIGRNHGLEQQIWGLQASLIVKNVKEVLCFLAVWDSLG